MEEQTLNSALANSQRRYGETPRTPTLEAPAEEVVEEPLADTPEEPIPEPTPPESPPEPAPPTRKFKYASQEEAERAQEEAARRMHEATAEAARIREQYDTAAKELAALKNPPEPPPAPKEAERLPGESLKSYIKRMRDLDYNSETYDDDVEGLWRNGLMSDPVIREFFRKEMEAVAEERFAQKIEQFRTTQAQEQERQRSAQTIQEQVLERAQSAGVDLQDEDLWDYFWTKAAPLADQSLPNAESMTEKIDYALDRVKTRFRLEAPAPAPATPESSPETPPPTGASEATPPAPPARVPPPMVRQSATVPSGGGNGSEAPKANPTLADHVQNVMNRRRI